MDHAQRQRCQSATKTPLPVLCAVCAAAGPAIEDLMVKENGITIDMSALGRFAKGGDVS